MDPDDFQNLISFSLSTITSVVKYSRRTVVSRPLFLASVSLSTGLGLIGFGLVALNRSCVSQVR